MIVQLFNFKKYLLNARLLTLIFSIIGTTFLFSTSVLATYSIQTIGIDTAYYSYSLDPGESIDDQVLVSNFGDETLSLNVSGVDVQIDSGGNFALNSSNNEQLEFGSWVDISTDIIELEPGDSKLIPFTISIPEDIYSGQYAGGLIAGTVVPDTSNHGVGGIYIATQVGLRIYVDVKGEIIDKLEWHDFEIGHVYDDNQYLDFSLSNEGNSLLEAFTVITVNENEIGQYPLGILQPGATITPKVAIHKPFIGESIISAEVFYKRSMSFSSEEIPVVSMGERSLTEKYFPWKLAGLLISSWLLLVMIVVVLTVRDRKFKKSLVKYKVKKTDDIEILAKRYKVSWRRLARLNELKAPYHLNPGDVLLVPKKKK